MQKIFTLFILIIFSIKVQSQTQNSHEIIVEGAAKIKIKPDIATFTLTIKKNDTIEKNAIKALNIEIKVLINSLFKIGFSSNSIKISDYNISSLIKDKHKKSYSASNILKVEFKINNKIIDDFYNELQQTPIKDLDVSFDTKMSDSLEKATRLNLTKLAIEDAIINANNIANTLNIKIAKVNQVQKNALVPFNPNKLELVKFTPPNTVADTEVKYKTSFEEFQVEEVELEERITIIYEISS